jgi:predicted nucleotidyltransferase/DNA-binding XRE family transcriptional regulator
VSATAGALIREARKRARLSQSELARRAGVAQSVISAYEADKREPGVYTLIKLVEASGHDLGLELIPRRPAPLGLPDTLRARTLRQHRRAVLELADEAGVHDVRIFGSVARGDDHATSDIDLLVSTDDGTTLTELAALRRKLGDLLGGDVDLVPEDSLKPRMRDKVLGEAVAL